MKRLSHKFGEIKICDFPLRKSSSVSQDDYGRGARNYGKNSEGFQVLQLANYLNWPRS